MPAPVHGTLNLPLGYVSKKSSYLLLARLSIPGKQLLLKAWSGVVSKAKKESCILEKLRDLVFQVTEIILEVELVESTFNVQKDDGFHELCKSRLSPPKSHHQ